MQLTERERDKLLIVVAADLARRRRARGLKLNHPEAVALITAELLEGIRDGRRVEDLMSWGATILTHDDVMDGVPDMIPEIQVEGAFPDGTKLVTVHDPIRPAANAVDSPDGYAEAPPTPGEYQLQPGVIELNAGRPRTALLVANTGDRPVQVGSHFHFYEVNRALRFERDRAYGQRLDVPAGTAVRFEPGESREVTLVPLGGERTVHGLSGLTQGPLDDPSVREAAASRVREQGFADGPAEGA